MSKYGHFEEIPVEETVDWSDQTGDTDILDITAIGWGGKRQFVRQSKIFVREAGGPRWLVSDGFGFCSALFVRDHNKQITFSHLLPSGDEAYYHFAEIGWQPEPREAVLVFGSLSSESYALTQAFSESRWGPCNVRQINVETGDTHWHLAFDCKTNQLWVVRKTPDHTIFRYALFR